MRCVIGIDEVGRGSLAGPVVVAAAMVTCPPRVFSSASVRRALGILKDSKKLSAAQRERWYGYFAAHPSVSFAVARVYPRQIEKRNISGAANLAAARAYKKLLARNGGASAIPYAVFLDGGLFLGSKAKQGNAKTVIKGDEKIPAVAIASIIAKVNRDRFMVKLAKQYPAYGFEVHKGYGTKKHREALRAIGLSSAHRRTFFSS